MARACLGLIGSRLQLVQAGRLRMGTDFRFSSSVVLIRFLQGQLGFESAE